MRKASRLISWLLVGTLITTMVAEPICTKAASNVEVNSEPVTYTEMEESGAGDFAEELQKSLDTSVNMTGDIGGYIETPFDNDAPVWTPDSYAGMEVLKEGVPSAYHNTLDELTSSYPATRDQSPYGACWAHAAMACAEFDLISDSKKDKTVDFSELHLAYFTYYLPKEPLGGFEGASCKYTGSESFMNVGGNAEMAYHRLAQWVGVRNDIGDLAYSNAGNVISNQKTSGVGLSEDYAYANNQAHLSNVYRINMTGTVEGCKDSKQVKQAIMEHGAAMVSYYHDDKYANKKDVTYEGKKYGGTYYMPSGTKTNHAVTLVGWDDSVPKEIFATGSSTAIPEGDGAWLCRNSWITISGMNIYSYFWLSYYDVPLNTTAYVMDFTADDGYDNNYQYDSGLHSTDSGRTKVANVFRTQNVNNVTSETLKAVAFSVSNSADVEYTIDIYTDLKDLNDPTSGVLQSAATTTGKTTYAGYYTIPLNAEIELAPDTTYAVVFSLKGSSGCGMDYELGYSDDNWFKDVTSVGQGQSFWYENGKWKDMYGYLNAYPEQKGKFGNFSIKAFTSNNEAVKTYHVTYELFGGTNAVGNPASFTVTDETIELQKPTRAGYVFDGWYRESDFSGSKVTSIPHGSNMDLTLYAKWTQITYTVKFDANGGSVSPASKTVAQYEQYGTLPTPIRDGYRFDGWYTEQSGGTQVTSTSVVDLSDKQTLYAHWTQLELTVTAGTYKVTKVYDGTTAAGTGRGTLALSGLNGIDASFITVEEISDFPTADVGKGKLNIRISASKDSGYNLANTIVSVPYEIKIADNVPNSPDSVEGCAGTNVATASLPANWEWKDSSVTFPETIGKTAKAVVNYTGKDKKNYKNISVTITLRAKNHDFYARDGKEKTSQEECSLCHVKNIAFEGLDISAETVIYNGSSQTAKIKGIDADKYTATGNVKTDPGTYEITLTGKNGYAGTRKIAWSIEKTTPADAKPPKKENATPGKGDEVQDDKGDAKYEVADATKKEVEYKAPANKKAKTVTIPAAVKINGVTYKVTRIDDNAFKGNKTVTKVTVGSNVKSIGKNAFSGATKLKKVSIGKNVTEIGANAFKGCSSLTGITIPSKVTKIGAYAFSGCKRLKILTIKSTRLTSKTVSKNAFKGLTKATTIKVPKKKLPAYKKLFRSRGQSSKVKVKKY